MARSPGETARRPTAIRAAPITCSGGCAAGQAGAVVVNAGLGANRLLRPRVGPAMAGRFERKLLGTAEATHLLIMAGWNDIASRPASANHDPADNAGARALAEAVDLDLFDAARLPTGARTVLGSREA